MADYLQKRAGNYTITRKLGDGGFATVFLAEHTVLEKKVAVKFLLEEWINEEDVVSRFFDEARTMERLKDHPNIVKIIDIAGKEKCESEGLPPYFIMDFVDGQSLEKRIHSDEGFSLEFVIHVIKTALSALGHCHDLGVVHRDIKPSNILIETDGQVKLTDFGIAKAKLNTSKTGNGLTLGSTDYMSPEQALGKRDLDYRTDIYSIGVTLYEMVTGKLPFIGDNPNMVALMHIQEPVVPPLQVNEAVPPRLSDLIVKAMSKDREARFQSCKEMIEALDRLDEPEPEPEVEEASDPLDLTQFPQGLPEEDLKKDSDVSLPEGKSTRRTHISEIMQGAETRNSLRLVGIFVAFTVLFLGAFNGYYLLTQGTLVFETVPAGAEIFLDDTMVGTTTLSLAKPAGSYKVALRLKKGDMVFEPEFSQIRLAARESKVIQRHLVRVTTRPREDFEARVAEYRRESASKAKDRQEKVQRAWQGICEFMKADDHLNRLDLHVAFLDFADDFSRLAAAEEFYKNLVAGNPENLLLLVMVGRAKELRKDWKGALDEYTKAFFQDRSYIPLLNILGSHFLNPNNPGRNTEKAKEYLKHSLYLNPDQPGIRSEFERL